VPWRGQPVPLPDDAVDRFMTNAPESEQIRFLLPISAQIAL
jgi:hypothetical protein